jgi:hypothetical protein
VAVLGLFDDLKRRNGEKRQKEQKNKKKAQQPQRVQKEPNNHNEFDKVSKHITMPSLLTFETLDGR